MNKKAVVLLSMTVCLAAPVWAQTELRVAVHDSFSLPKPLLQQFEQQNNIKLSVIKGGDSGELLNKLILTRAKPIADVVYGLDNVSVYKAQKAGILAANQPKVGAATVNLPHAVSVDYGYVVLNYDKAWFAKNKRPLPRTLADLTQPQYKDLLVVPSPATSSPGLAFLMANIAGLGEQQAFDWWAKMRANGVKVSKGWSDAYYNEFSQNGGSRPLVVSYASSPAAEVFFSKGKYTNDSPTGNLFLKGGVFQQVEGAAVLAGTNRGAEAAKFIQFLRSPAVQKAIPTEMWVYPVVNNVPLDPVYRFAQVPKSHDSLPAATLSQKQQQWVSRWSRTVLR